MDWSVFVASHMPDSWADYLGSSRSNWIGHGSNIAAGYADSLSFGLTSYARRGLGWDNVNYNSDYYFGGQVAGTVHSIAMMGAGGGRNMVRQGSFRRGFYDNRTWDSVRRTWSGSPPILEARRQALHHVIIPQRWTWVPQGIRNAGFNYMPMNAWRNSVLLNRYPWLLRPYEQAYRLGYLTQFSSLVNPFFGRYPGSYYSGGGNR